MFRRRIPRSYGRVAREALWPRGGWGRAASYAKHRLRRLPDPPERIARGVGAGVLAVFTPMFGFHLILAALLAKLARGNIVAALLGSFSGNPLTFPFIAVLSMELGHWILGTTRRGGEEPGPVLEAFARASADLWHNARAAFSEAEAHWSGLDVFWSDVFLPYAVGGLLPGVVAALLAYAVTVPVVTAYQRRRAQLALRRLERLERARDKVRRGGVAG